MSIADLIPMVLATRMEPRKPTENKRTRWARKNRAHLKTYRAAYYRRTGK